jgi:hypothetical protein
MQEPAGSAGSPDANPFIGASGLALVTDVDGIAGTGQLTSVVINNDEDVYALARRVFGKAERFVDIVLLNKLEFPFIVADPESKPPNTLAWGERVLVPASSQVGAAIQDDPGVSAVPTTSGVVDISAPLSQLVDSTARWMPDQWVGYSVTVVTGGDRQTLVCNGNTSDHLSLSGVWSVAIVPGTTTYSLSSIRFEPRRPPTADSRAYGTDLLVEFGSDGLCDLVVDATSDLALATGIDNLIQAITLRSRCPLGEHPFHKTYGLLPPVGRPLTGDVGVLHSFFARRSLLSDPRISKVRNIQLNLVGDTLTMSAEVQPIDSRSLRPITIAVGA